MINVIDINEIPNRGTKSKIIKDIEDFVSSGAEACEVFSDGMRANSRYESYYAAIKAAGHPVKAVKRKDRLFLVRKDADEK